MEEHLALTCDRIGAGVRGLLPERSLELVLLGGGYGRGEGGVWRTPSGDRPYNDLELYVFLHGNRHLNERIHGRALHVLGEILTPQAGVEVELRIASLAELAASGVSMFSYDLVCGHRVVHGDAARLDRCAHHRDAEGIPLAEATRLLMNRATGLLFARERLARRVLSPGDIDFVARNIAKAQLGAGDAVLTVLGEYHWSVRERHRRVVRTLRGNHGVWFEELCRHHSVGEAFKLHPLRSAAGRDELAARHAEVSTLCERTWRWIESRRLQKSFPSIAAYIEDEGDKCPETAPWRNALVNAKVFGARGLASRRGRHPRNVVLGVLPRLLWQTDALASPAAMAVIQRELRTSATDFAGLVDAYREVWALVN